jgi:hypothetical protein
MLHLFALTDNYGLSEVFRGYEDLPAWSDCRVKIVLEDGGHRLGAGLRPILIHAWNGRDSFTSKRP